MVKGKTHTPNSLQPLLCFLYSCFFFYKKSFNFSPGVGPEASLLLQPFRKPKRIRHGLQSVPAAAPRTRLREKPLRRRPGEEGPRLQPQPHRDTGKETKRLIPFTNNEFHEATV